MVKLDAAPGSPGPRSAAKRSAPEGDEGGGKGGKLRWVLGWVVIPVATVLLPFLLGMHVGARNPDMWLARMLLRMFGGG